MSMWAMILTADQSYLIGLTAIPLHEEIAQRR